MKVQLEPREAAPPITSKSADRVVQKLGPEQITNWLLLVFCLAGSGFVISWPLWRYPAGPSATALIVSGVGGLVLALLGVLVIYPLGAMIGAVDRNGFRPPAASYSIRAWVGRHLRATVRWHEVERVQLVSAVGSDSNLLLKVFTDDGSGFVFYFVGRRAERDAPLAAAIVDHWCALHGAIETESAKLTGTQRRILGVSPLERK